MAEARKRRKLSNGSYDAVQPAEKSEQATSDKKSQNRSLFVRSLPASVTTERLIEHFSQSYPLKHATVVVDPKTKISKGFGFVTFTDHEDAQAAATEFNDTVLDGRKIKVEVAESRHRDVVEEGGKSGPNKTAAQLRAGREKERTDAQPPRLIVRNLPWSIKEPEDLALLFRSYGKVKHAIVPKRSPKVQSGFGFVVIRGRKNAEKALEGVNGKEIDGRTLAVDWAVDKKTWEELQNETTGVGESEEKSEGGLKNGEQQNEDASDIEPNGIGTKDVEVVSDTSSEDASSDDEGMDADEDLHEGLEDDTPESEDIGEDEGKKSSNNTTIFIRNLPFTATDEELKSHFVAFGPVRYARVVMDAETERSRGTAFVCFFNEEDAKTCVKDAPKQEISAPNSTDKKRRGEAKTHSILQNEATDPSGRYTLDGRVLQVSRALSKEDAAQRAEEGSAKRDIRDRDKRRLYLLSEGTISKSSTLYNQLGTAELDIREASARQRQKLMKTNPNLMMSLTRLSVRNVPRSIDSKDLKALAREAVVGFATDVKNGIRQPLSKEETNRGGEAMKEAERRRKLRGVGIVSQAKVVFEGREGGKVKEAAGAGRSRGYGFIEYVTHRHALMGLRWLNGHVVKTPAAVGVGGEKSKRLIVEFAIENAQVVQRREERETKVRLNPDKSKLGNRGEKSGKPSGARESNKNHPGGRGNSKKRKREEQPPRTRTDSKLVVVEAPPAPGKDEQNKMAKRNRIIAKKRQMRKTRKG